MSGRFGVNCSGIFTSISNLAGFKREKSFEFAKNDCEKYHPAAQTANRCFSRKKPPDFVIFPEFVLDNGGGVWYHTFVR